MKEEICSQLNLLDLQIPLLATLALRSLGMTLVFRLASVFLQDLFIRWQNNGFNAK